MQRPPKEFIHVNRDDLNDKYRLSRVQDWIAERYYGIRPIDKHIGGAMFLWELYLWRKETSNDK